MSEEKLKGLPFSKILGENILDFIKHINNGFAVMVIIEGPLGVGKTTLAVEIVDFINQLYNYPVMDFKGPQFALGGKDFKAKIRKCYAEKLHAIAYDEAGDFSKRGALTSFNRDLINEFEKCRAFKCIIVLTLPSFLRLDFSIFEQELPVLLLRVNRRYGKPSTFKGYDFNTMLNLRRRADKYSKEFAYKTITPNFTGQFKDLSKFRSEDLHKVCTLFKIKSENEDQHNYEEHLKKLNVKK